MCVLTGRFGMVCFARCGFCLEDRSAVLFFKVLETFKTFGLNACYGKLFRKALTSGLRSEVVNLNLNLGVGFNHRHVEGGSPAHY